MTTITGRPPKLSPAEQSRLLFQYTIGASKRSLAAEWKLSQKTVTAYIRGTHKNPALRSADY